MPESTLTIRVGQDRERAFYYRPGTSDEQVINDVLVKSSYDLRRLDRTKRQHRHADIVRFLDDARKRTRKKPLIIDAGANIGASPLLFLSNCLDAKVVAIEPESSNFSLMQRNVAGLDVECVQAAVSAHPGRARLVNPEEGHWGYRTEIVAGGNIPCVTVCDIFQRHAASHFPFLVKIDIEGGEAELFSANTEWVAQTPVLIVEPHDWLVPNAALSQSFLRCVSALNRDLIVVGEDIYSIANHLM